MKESSRMLVAILGPQTRVAKSLLSSGQMSQAEVLLFARHQREAEELSAVYPHAIIAPAWETHAPVLQRYEKIGVLCCALGVIHPTSSNFFFDVDVALRDLRNLEWLLRAYPEASVHVVFVSSVLALAPDRGREYYGGWKSVIMGVLSQLLQDYPKAWFSVLFPGRLVERRSLTLPLSILYTSYSTVARILLKTLTSNAPRHAIVGLDARLWLIKRGIEMWWSAATARPKRGN